MAQQSAAMTAPRAPAAPTPWQGLRQRFDGGVLRPPAASAASATGAPRSDGAALAARDIATRAALLAWCQRGAGPGGAPFWQPGDCPRVDRRLAVGALRVADTDRLAWVDQVARQLDGSLRLEGLPSRAAGLALRLGVKTREAMWWRRRQPDDPWDAGWAIDTPAALHRLQTRFQPRRATLVLADTRSFAALQAGLAALLERQAGFRHPVRWLWVGGETDQPPPPGQAITHFELA